MTRDQFKKLKEQYPSKFHPKFADMVDAGTIGTMNAAIANRLPTEDQILFVFQAVHFGAKAFEATVNWWMRMSEDRRVLTRQIFIDIHEAFDEWESWSGNKVGDEVEEHERMVAEARARVLAFIAHLKVPLPKTSKTLVE